MRTSCHRVRAADADGMVADEDDAVTVAAELVPFADARVADRARATLPLKNGTLTRAKC